MVLIREAKGRKQICDALICSSLWRQARGLILSKRKNLLFVFPEPTRVRLHMMFVVFPIEVIGLDSEKRVSCARRLLPFQTWKCHSEVKYIIELSKKPYVIPQLGTKLTF